jgi:hypothetical protein
MVTQQEHEEAVARGQGMLRTRPRAVSARFDVQSKTIVIGLNWGYSIIFPPERCQDLANANPEDLTEIEITHPGFGVYFPRLDADLWVPGLAQGVFGTKQWEAQWATEHQVDRAPESYRQSSLTAC